MKRFLNTFYVLSEDIYLSLEGENVVAMRDKQEVARYPLHTLQGIVSFSYAGASPALMGACAKRGVGFALCTPNGRFLARVSGEISGNVLLRRTQYRTADDNIEGAEDTIAVAPPRGERGLKYLFGIQQLLGFLSLPLVGSVD